MSVQASYKVEMCLDGSTWSDVTEDLQLPILLEDGIRQNAPLERVAGTGEMTLMLRNDRWNSGTAEGYYSPGHSSCRSGFAPGIPVRWSLVYESTSYPLFYGKIPPDGIQIEGGALGGKLVEIRVRDFIEDMANHELQVPEFTENKRLDEIIQLILDNMATSPLSTDLEPGEDTFNNVFDTTRERTRALAEAVKAVISELGYLYVRHLNGWEVVRSEGRFTQADENLLRLRPDKEDGYLEVMCAEDDTDDVALTTEDGDVLLLEQVDASFDNSMIGTPEVSTGKNLYNQVKATAYPRNVDSAATTVLFSLENALQLPAGETKTLTGRYRDPNGAATYISGRDMVSPPVSGTDYLMNANSSGTGADLTANLTIVATYGANMVVYTLTNTGATDGYLTKLQARGKGIYLYDPVGVLVEDAASQAVHGIRVLNLDMKYQDDPWVAQDFATVLLTQNVEEKTTLESVPFSANRDSLHMLALCKGEIGRKVHLKENVSGVEGDFFILGRRIECYGEGDIVFSWVVTQSGYGAITFFELDKSELDGDDGLAW